MDIFCKILFHFISCVCVTTNNNLEIINERLFQTQEEINFDLIETINRQTSYYLGSLLPENPISSSFREFLHENEEYLVCMNKEYEKIRSLIKESYMTLLQDIDFEIEKLEDQNDRLKQASKRLYLRSGVMNMLDISNRLIFKLLKLKQLVLDNNLSFINDSIDFENDLEQYLNPSRYLHAVSYDETIINIQIHFVNFLNNSFKKFDDCNRHFYESEIMNIKKIFNILDNINPNKKSKMKRRNTL